MIPSCCIVNATYLTQILDSSLRSETDLVQIPSNTQFKSRITLRHGKGFLAAPQLKHSKNQHRSWEETRSFSTTHQRESSYKLYIYIIQFWELNKGRLYILSIQMHYKQWHKISQNTPHHDAPRINIPWTTTCSSIFIWLELVSPLEQPIHPTNILTWLQVNSGWDWPKDSTNPLHLSDVHL